MTLQELEQGLALQTKIEERKELINYYNHGHIKSVILEHFNDETGSYETFIHTAHIPRKNIKNEVLRVLNVELDSLQDKFSHIGKIQTTDVANEK